MVKVIPIKQGSDDWLEYRRGKITGSKLGNIYSRRKNSAPKEGFYDLMGELLKAAPITADLYDFELDGKPFSMIERGHLLEPEALRLFAKRHNKKLVMDSVVWVSDFDDRIMISPDAWVEGDPITEAVEAKCPGTKVVLRCYIEEAYPDEYKEQVLQYFVVNDDLQTLWFIIYTDVVPGLGLQVFEIKREDLDDEIEAMKEFEIETLDKIDELIKGMEEK